ncbi:unnamed protein product [Penicillium olsonii]|nr:unnamed protein product [Penicillium olsonii]
MPDTANSSLLDEFVLAELNDTQLRDPDGTSDDTTDDNDTADDRADEFPRPLGMDHSIDSIRVGGLSLSVAADDRPYGDSGQAVELPTCVYQAPELMFESEFGYAVDIWSFGCWAWELVHGQPLFSSVLEMEGEGFEDGGNRLVGYRAVAWNIRSLLGPPPPDLRTGMANSSHFDRAMFDDEDIWRGPVPFEDARVLLEEDEHLKVDDREQFLDLMKDMVQWRPEDRKTAGELLAHPWFAGFGLFTVPTSDHHQVDDAGGAPSSTTEKLDYANGGPISPTSYGEQDISA